MESLAETIYQERAFDRIARERGLNLTLGSRARCKIIFPFVASRFYRQVAEVISGVASAPAWRSSAASDPS
jgi:hypothetical protein